MTPRIPPIAAKSAEVTELMKLRRVASPGDVSIDTLISSAEGISYRHSCVKKGDRNASTCVAPCTDRGTGNPCCGARSRRLEGARRRKPWCVCARRPVHSQVRHGGKGFPCGRWAWRDLLGSLSHGEGSLRRGGDLHTDEAKRQSHRLRPGVRRGRCRGRGADVRVFHDRAGRHVPGTSTHGR